NTRSRINSRDYRENSPNLKRKPMEFQVGDKKCHADEPLAVPLNGLHFDDKLHFVEKPVEIVDHEVKRLKQSRIPLVKVRWNSKRGPEFTYIKYALTVNPHIYVSCIKQFWNTVVVKQSNDITRLQALVDKKKVVITEATIRDALRLDDAEGVDCLPNEEIFAELARMGYEKPSTKLTFYKSFFSSQWKFLIHTILQSLSAKRTSWNKFSSTMASAVICLSTLENLISLRVIEEGGDAEEQFKMLLLILLLKELILLFQEMMFKTNLFHLLLHLLHRHNNLKIFYQHHRRVEHLEYDKVAQALEITKLKRRVKKLEKANKVKVLKLKRLKKVGTSQRIGSSDDTVMEDASNQGRMIDALDSDACVALMDDKEDEKKAEEANVAGDDQVKGRQAKIYKIDMDHASKVLSKKEDELEVQEVVDVVTTARLITEVVTAASKSVTAASTTIVAAESQVPAATITAAPVRVAAASTRRRKGVVIRDPKEESTTIIPADTKSKDKGKGIMVEEPKPMKKKQQVEMDEEYQVMKKRPQTEAQARRNMIMYLKNVVGFRLDYFEGMSYDDIRLIFKAKFNSNITFLLKSKENLEEEENRAIQSINETPTQKAAKRRKLNKEVKDLKQHLEIVPDEDDYVYTEATALARKVHVVDYEIIHVNNKPHYKIIRADGTQQLYVSFITLLKNFDREDLESLWSLVKERFYTSKTNNFSDDFLLTTLGAMFERPYGQAQVWKSQRTVHGQVKDLVLPSKVAAVELVLLKDELMLLSQVNTANDILMLSRQS
nr:putative reverse transcriptase domain-containing protein [Tanacetum cinerariifolium]